MKAPHFCPMCSKTIKCKQVDNSKKVFSVGKVVVGGFLLGLVVW